MIVAKKYNYRTFCHKINLGVCTWHEHLLLGKFLLFLLLKEVHTQIKENCNCFMFNLLEAKT